MCAPRSAITFDGKHTCAFLNHSITARRKFANRVFTGFLKVSHCTIVELSGPATGVGLLRPHARLRLHSASLARRSRVRCSEGLGHT